MVAREKWLKESAVRRGSPTPTSLAPPPGHCGAFSQADKESAAAARQERPSSGAWHLIAPRAQPYNMPFCCVALKLRRHKQQSYTRRPCGRYGVFTPYEIA